MKREELEDEIRQVVLSSVEVDGLTAADLPPDAPLFGEGVGLDSIDALEIGAALRQGMRMARDFANVLNLRPAAAKKHMVDLHADGPHYMEAMLHHQ